MALLPFARQHVVTELPAIAPEVAAGVSPGSFALARRYLGSSVVFFDRQGAPALTYKLVSDPSLNFLLDNAVRCAKEARCRGVATQAIYASGRLHGRAFAAYSWLPGVPLHDPKHPPAPEAPVSARAAEAIADLHARTRREAGPDLASVRQRADWWRELLAAHPALPAGLRRTIDGALALLLKWAPRLPGVLMHGDCAGVNLLRDAEGNIAFIDWELGLPAGLPGIDLATLLLDHFGSRPDSRGRGPTLARCFLEPGPVAEECRQVLHAYAERLGLPEAALPIFVAATHVKMVAEDRHWTVLHQGPGSRDRMVEDLEVLERALEICQGPSPQAGRLAPGLGLCRSELRIPVSEVGYSNPEKYP